MAVESFKNISMSFKGTGLNAILDDVTIAKYATSLQGLTLQQANLALSTTDLSAKEKELILTKAGLIATTDALTAQEVLSTFQTEIGNKVDARQILIRSQLITEKQLEENATINLTWAQIQEAVAKGRLSVENAKILTSSLGVQGANYGEAVSFSVLTKAIGSTIKAIGTFLLTNPVGWAIITAGAIAGTVALVDTFTISLDEAKENLSNLKDECNSIESDLSSMNDELKTTVDRMKELEDKDALTFTEKEEYDNLVKTNKELQRNIDLLELEQKIKNKEKNKTFVQAMDISANTNVSMMGTSTNVALKDYVQGQLKVYRTLIADGISEDEEKQVEYLENYFYDISKEWDNIAKDIQYIRNPSTEDEKAVNEWLDFVNDFKDKMAIAMGGTNAKSNAFNRLVDNWQFDSNVQGLQDLGKEGKVTAEMLDDPKYDEFIQKLVEIGIIDSADNLDLIALAFNGVSDALDGTTTSTNNATTSVTSLANTFKALKESLEDIINYADTYQSAMAKIAAGTTLTADEVMELLEIDPSLFNKFIKDKDGWKIDLGDLQLSYSAKVNKQKDNIIGASKKELQEQLKSEQANLDELIAEKAGLIVNDRVTRDMSASLDKQILEAKARIEQIEQDIGLSDMMGNVLDYSSVELANASFEIVTDTIKDYNSEIKSLNDAIDALNEGNSLSYDDMTELVNLYPQLQDKVVKTADGYTIEISALEDVRTKSYQTRNDYIDNQKAIVQAAIEGAKKRIEAYKHEVNAINSQFAYEAALQSGLLAAYNSEISQLEGLENLLDVLDSLKNDVIDSDNSSSSSNKTGDLIQQQIDYYNNLIKAIEAVADKQIDRLNDEKEALREKNDEQQRELDLLEAKNNLEKAKKQKVFVYKEGQGLVQVQDEKAVADAQKEYDDVQKEIKEAEIDKQIDAFEDYKKQFSEMSSQAENALAIEQAKKVLKTDENGLLNLSHDIVTGIRDNLAKAIYDKDIEDNKDNSKYVTVTLEDYLKSLGATVTPKQFQAMANTVAGNIPISAPITNSTVNNAQSIVDNKSVTLYNTFNITDSENSSNIVEQIKNYMNRTLRMAINSIK